MQGTHQLYFSPLLVVPMQSVQIIDVFFTSIFFLSRSVATESGAELISLRLVYRPWWDGPTSSGPDN